MGCAELVVGYLSSSSLLSCCGRWEREGIRMVREKKKEYILVIQSYSNRAYLHGYYSKCVNMHIFTPIDEASFGGKLCNF